MIEGGGPRSDVARGGEKRVAIGQASLVVIEYIHILLQEENNEGFVNWNMRRLLTFFSVIGIPELLMWDQKLHWRGIWIATQGNTSTCMIY